MPSRARRGCLADIAFFARNINNILARVLATTYRRIAAISLRCIMTRTRLCLLYAAFERLALRHGLIGQA